MSGKDNDDHGKKPLKDEDIQSQRGGLKSSKSAAAVINDIDTDRDLDNMPPTAADYQPSDENTNKDLDTNPPLKDYNVDNLPEP